MSLAVLVTLSLSPFFASQAVAAQKIDPGFLKLFNDIWPEAKKKGVSPETHLGVLHWLGKPDFSLGNVRRTLPRPPKKPDPNAPPAKKAKPKKLDRLTLPGKCYKRPQREFLRPANYFPEGARWGLDGVVKRGQEKLREHEATLKAVQSKFYVKPSVLLAIWGRETNFGQNIGRKNVLRLLATRAAYGRGKWRRTFSRRHLIAALQIVQDGHVTKEGFKGNWLGATGHTQFMPVEFYRYAVNGDADPSKIDIWSSPGDAFASTANFLLTKGSHYKNGKTWQPGVSWGYEVKLPKGFDCSLEGRSVKKPIRTWAERFGIHRVADRKFAQSRLEKPAYLMLPAGTKGPAFLALNNFEVFRHYNKSDLYALYLGYVADRINCDTDEKNCTFHKSWPAKQTDYKFSVKKMCGLQILLREHGLYDEKIDGLFGAGTRVAIGRFEKKAGRTPTCYPAQSLTKAMCKGYKKTCARLRRQGAL